MGLNLEFYHLLGRWCEASGTWGTSERSRRFCGVIIGQTKQCHHCPHGQSFGSKYLPVFSPTLSSLPDLPEISVSHANLTVREGDNAVITCNGSGSPLPDVDWIVTGLQSINTHQVGV